MKLTEHEAATFTEWLREEFAKQAASVRLAGVDGIGPESLSKALLLATALDRVRRHLKECQL